MRRFARRAVPTRRRSYRPNLAACCEIQCRNSSCVFGLGTIEIRVRGIDVLVIDRGAPHNSATRAALSSGRLPDDLSFMIGIQRKDGAGFISHDDDLPAIDLS